MNREEMSNIAKKTLDYVSQFFSGLKEEEKHHLPAILKSPGRWIANYQGLALGIFFLNEAALKRVSAYQNKGYPAFPGFMFSEDQKPANVTVAVAMGGSCNFFSSNHTSNVIAFIVQAGSSFTVVDHFHEIKDSSGEEFKYQIDLAFVLGIHEGEQWDDLEPRITELLNHSISVWRKLQ